MSSAFNLPRLFNFVQANETGAERSTAKEDSFEGILLASKHVRETQRQIQMLKALAFAQDPSRCDFDSFWRASHREAPSSPLFGTSLFIRLPFSSSCRVDARHSGLMSLKTRVHSAMAWWTQSAMEENLFWL
jgi:hypothetical protein